MLAAEALSLLADVFGVRLAEAIVEASCRRRLSVGDEVGVNKSPSHPLNLTPSEMSTD